MDDLVIRQKIENNIERITESGCWIWMRSLRGNKYGHFQVPGKGLVSAHRSSYEAYIGPIPKGKFVLHLCDVTMCCNPSHLYLGDQLDNITDMWKKDRGGINKLSREDVIAIRRLSTQGTSRREIRRQFGISKPQLGKIITGKSWAWV